MVFPDIKLWLPVLAVAFGGATHALSTDGGGSVLARFGVTTAIPRKLVFPLVLFFGLCAGVFEDVQHGVGWEEAASRGALATLSALFGVISLQHLTGRDASGAPKAPLVILVVLFFAPFVAACTPDARLALVETVVDKTSCVIANIDLPDAQLALKCGYQPGDEDRYRRIVAQARAQSAAAGAHAAAVQRDLDAVTAGCAH